MSRKSPFAQLARSPMAQLKRRLSFELTPLEERGDIMEAAEVAWSTLKDLAAGRAYVPILPDGREGDPRVPTDSVRLKAAIELLDRLYGKAPTSSEMAERKAAVDANPTKNLTDAELVQQVKEAVDVLEGNKTNIPTLGKGE